MSHSWSATGSETWKGGDGVKIGCSALFLIVMAIVFGLVSEMIMISRMLHPVIVPFPWPACMASGDCASASGYYLGTVGAPYVFAVISIGAAYYAVDMLRLR